MTISYEHNRPPELSAPDYRIRYVSADRSADWSERDQRVPRDLFDHKVQEEESEEHKVQ